MPDNTIFITNEAVVSIYLIGYKNMGESIILEINDKSWKRPICGIIDCFKLGNLNKTLDILINNNIEKLNFVFWTHPDKDHSYGLDDILEYFKDNIGILGISEGISVHELKNSIPKNIPSGCNYLKKIFDLISNISANIQDDFISINHATGNLINLNFQMQNGDKYIFSIKPFAPLSYICRSECLKVFNNLINENDDKYSILKNKISTGFICSVGNRKICFTGDIINEALPNGKYFEALKQKFTDIDFFKIPHHGGKSSDKFLDLLPKYINYAGVTRFNKSNPDFDVIQKYKICHHAQVLSTTNFDEKKNVNDFGIIKISIPFNSLSPIQTSFIGNACVL